ncbi:FecR family protein [Sphingobacterium sp. SYP-B4668]|uniref:FecR family protein n=1 Tax=Sphingobacterium sp. SYP-B4668 TaxID=2996035 RepID=UPI0022DCEE64|nr:FecR domain-containing protein [Sphingobacterium sp. SYP-B4668]
MKHRILNIINRFWKGKLSKEGRHQLLSQLENPDELLVDELHQDFANSSADVQLHTQEDYDNILLSIHEKMGVVKSLPARRSSLVGWSIAASFIVGVSVVGYLMMSVQSPSELGLGLANTHTLERNLVNDGIDTLMFKMPDGSRIAVYPHSSVSYMEDYGVIDRKLSLVGMARFTVAHDTLRPFIVLANGYTTTALGTEFTVNGHLKNVLSVKLLSGKIVVKSTESSLFAFQDQILEPGQELLIDNQRKSTSLLNSLIDKVKKTPVISKNRVNVEPVQQGIQFEQTPLTEVFATIARLKGATINIEHAALTGLSFTGKLEKHYTVDVMLSIVCQMNELTYTYDNDTIIVKNIQQTSQ